MSKCPYCLKDVTEEMEDVVDFGVPEQSELAHIDCAVEHDRDSRVNGCGCHVCIAEWEKEHMGDPDLKTGIYHPDNINKSSNAVPVFTE